MILRLHHSSDNSLVLIHDEDVMTFRYTEKGKTKILFKDRNFDSLYVNESTERIYNMLSGTPEAK